MPMFGRVNESSKCIHKQNEVGLSKNKKDYQISLSNVTSLKSKQKQMGFKTLRKSNIKSGKEKVSEGASKVTLWI